MLIAGIVFIPFCCFHPQPSPPPPIAALAQQAAEPSEPSWALSYESRDRWTIIIRGLTREQCKALRWAGDGELKCFGPNGEQE